MRIASLNFLLSLRHCLCSHSESIFLRCSQKPNFQELISGDTFLPFFPAGWISINNSENWSSNKGGWHAPNWSKYSGFQERSWWVSWDNWRGHVSIGHVRRRQGGVKALKLLQHQHTITHVNNSTQIQVQTQGQWIIRGLTAGKNPIRVIRYCLCSLIIYEKPSRCFQFNVWFTVCEFPQFQHRLYWKCYIDSIFPNTIIG